MPSQTTDCKDALPRRHLLGSFAVMSPLLGMGLQAEAVTKFPTESSDGGRVSQFAKDNGWIKESPYKTPSNNLLPVIDAEAMKNLIETKKPEPRDKKPLIPGLPYFGGDNIKMP